MPIKYKQRQKLAEELEFYEVVINNLEKIDEVIDLVSMNKISHRTAYHRVLRYIFEIKNIYL